MALDFPPFTLHLPSSAAVLLLWTGRQRILSPLVQRQQDTHRLEQAPLRHTFRGFPVFHRPQSVCAVSSRTNSPIAQSPFPTPRTTQLHTPLTLAWTNALHPDQSPKSTTKNRKDGSRQRRRDAIPFPDLVHQELHRRQGLSNTPVAPHPTQLTPHPQVDFQAVATEMEIVSKAAA